MAAPAVCGDDARRWVIDGTKSFITNSGTSITGVAAVAAVTGTHEGGKPEISTILVPFLATLDEGRVAIAALSTGLAQGCVDESLRYVRDRNAFGGPIGRFQALQFKIADMEARASPVGRLRG